MGAYGGFLTPGVRQVALGSGIATDFGILLPPGTRVAAIVNSNGIQDGDSIQGEYGQQLVTTLNAGLAYARSGRGDVVVVMPDHAESISSADQMSNLVPGTTILGLGTGDLRPTFTWTAAAATFLMDQDNVRLANCILKMADAGNAGVTVAAPITVSGASCSIEGCKVFFGADADDNVAIGVTTTAAATDFTFEGNECYGATAAECTTFLQIVGGVRAKLLSNRIVGATSATGVGLIRFLTTASTDVVVDGLNVRNNKALSTVAITGLAACSGEVNNLFMTVLSNNAAALTGAFATPASFVFGRQCYVANLIAERAALFGTESA